MNKFTEIKFTTFNKNKNQEEIFLWYTCDTCYKNYISKEEVISCCPVIIDNNN